MSATSPGHIPTVNRQFTLAARPVGMPKESDFQLVESPLSRLSENQILLRTRIGALNRVSQNAYALWDVYAACSRGKVHPFVQIANITNTSYQEIQGVQMPGRSLMAGLEFLWRGR